MSTADNLINSGNPVGTPIVTGTPATSGDAETVLTNSGGAQFGGLTNTDDDGMIAIDEPNEGGLRMVRPPTGTGNATVYQPFGVKTVPDSGFAYKKVIIRLYGLQNTSNQKYTLALPSPFLDNYMIWTAQCPTIELLSNGQPQTFNKASGVDGGNLGVQSMGQFDWASGIGPIDAIRFGINDALVSNGDIIIEGI